MADGFVVDLGALERAAAGVNGTLDEVGRQRPSDIPHEPAAIGHDALAGMLSDFLGRWQRGVDNLVKDGQEIAGRLAANVNAYVTTEQGLNDHFSGILRGGGPDPGVR